MQGVQETPFVELKHISKSFPGVKVLEDISIPFYRGKVHVLLGENGAGKSTVMGMISRLIAEMEDLSSLKGRISENEEQRALEAPCDFTQSNHIQMKLTVEELVALEDSLTQEPSYRGR